MTQTELRDYILLNKSGRPSEILTDKQWQKEFEIRKKFVVPYPSNIKRLGGKHSKTVGFWNEETMGTYYGETNWQQYCSYINDVLKNIRKGEIEYCYYIYQIIDLLKFHYDDLKTHYDDGYWSVWLEDN